MEWQGWSQGGGRARPDGLDVNPSPFPFDSSGRSVTTARNGHLHPAGPDSRFAQNLVTGPLRDWFTKTRNLQGQVQGAKDRGYELGGRSNLVGLWRTSADFFTNGLSRKNQRASGSMANNGLRQEGFPSLGCGFTDALGCSMPATRQGHPERPAGRRMGQSHGKAGAVRVRLNP